MRLDACEACAHQLRLKRLDLPHSKLVEVTTAGYGAGFWRWREVTYLCAECGTHVFHTSSKTHRGACWMEAKDGPQASGPANAY